MRIGTLVLITGFVLLAYTTYVGMDTFASIGEEEMANFFLEFCSPLFYVHCSFLFPF